MLQGFCVTNVIMMTPENHYHNHKRYLVITVFPLRYHSLSLTATSPGTKTMYPLLDSSAFCSAENAFR